MVHRGERVEDRAVERAAEFDGDVGGRLFGELPDDDGILRLERDHRALLQSTTAAAPIVVTIARTSGGGRQSRRARRMDCGR
jgi:hypothetical protein